MALCPKRIAAVPEAPTAARARGEVQANDSITKMWRGSNAAGLGQPGLFD
ncbi:hypothetical protein MAHJHV54_48040 [Mycobacterium avium subsp. hominissuis]